jgi:Erythromycin biosynthesis protein CIII-like, C-terminal domain/Erythromycin biosynthesis protein CIII-like, N-terminal domain
VRVLFTTTGHSGHLLPLVPLARACQRAGHDVLVATHAPRADNVERLGLPVHPIEVAPDEAWAPLMSRLPGLPQSDGDALIIAEGFARIGAGGALPGFLAAVAQWRPELVVHECYEFAGPIAAERHGVRTARVALGLASTEDWVTELAAPAVANLRREAGLAPQGEDAAALLSIVPPGLDDGPAERFRDAAPPAPQALADWWADAEAPLVYVTLGSVTGSLAAFYPGLYRSVLDALAPLAVRVLLTIGRDADPAALGPLPANGHAEAWLSQHDVLPHAAAVVSHAGYGTTLGALEHGVGQVLLPLFAGDQWRTARRVAQLGAGVQLGDGERRVFDPPRDAVIAALPDAVLRVLDDARFAEVARRLGEEMAGLPAADAAAATLVG